MELAVLAPCADHSTRQVHSSNRGAWRLQSIRVAIDGLEKRRVLGSDVAGRDGPIVTDLALHVEGELLGVGRSEIAGNNRARQHVRVADRRQWSRLQSGIRVRRVAWQRHRVQERKCRKDVQRNVDEREIPRLAGSM